MMAGPPEEPVTPALSSPPLWRQLQAAASILAAVRGGESATPAIARVSADLRPAAQALSYHAMRYLGRADALLCTALALCWREVDAPYPSFTLVDQAVEAAKRSPATAPQSGFLNACLRRFLRERDALVAATEQELVAQWNHPAWWIERLRKDHPQRWQAILQASNSAAPMTLRVNARKSSREAVLERFAQAGIDGTAIGEYGIVLARAQAVHDIPGFDQGLVSVQDAAAQVAAPLLLAGLEVPADRPLRILDACAAPGGKTAHLLEMADAQVTALDVDSERCKRIEATLARLGLDAGIVAADAAKPDDWWDRRPFDAILLDAPCTASGIVRRHPDVRWLRRASDVAQLAAQQSRLLLALWPLLRPGGRLLYCTCSVFHEEGQGRIEAFLAHHKGAVLRPGPGHLLPQSRANPEGLRDNLAGDHDGFFYALLEKHERAAAAVAAA